MECFACKSPQQFWLLQIGSEANQFHIPGLCQGLDLYCSRYPWQCLFWYSSNKKRENVYCDESNLGRESWETVPARRHRYRTFLWATLYFRRKEQYFIMLQSLLCINLRVIQIPLTSLSTDHFLLEILGEENIYLTWIPAEWCNTRTFSQCNGYKIGHRKQETSMAFMTLVSKLCGRHPTPHPESN